VGNLRRVILCLAAGLDVNVIVDCYYGQTWLQAAISFWCLSRERKLRNGLKEEDEEEDEEAEDMYEAEEVIKLLLRHGADVKARNCSGGTPLHYLATGDVPSTVPFGITPNPVAEMLLRRGADVNAVSEYGETPLHLAVMHSRCRDMVAALLEQGADPNILARKDRSALFYALASSGPGVYRVVELLLQYGADPNAVDSKGEPLLNYTFRKANFFEHPLEVLALLVDYGADPNQSDWRIGKSALHCAIHSQRLNVVALFLKNGADPNIVDNMGRSSLHYAMERRLSEVVRLLVAGGALIEKLEEKDRELVKTICEPGKGKKDFRKAWKKHKRAKERGKE
jgi:ankyrin repeat protein